ncbi:ATP-binding cassette domain-containing protein [Lactobacillus sp. R2/2]|nr:ATP-binding cassette domain-containing protein [Lactobacillus sp. R2/2]MEB3364623.1 ATP-binding cassette domain-containing protein [Lactobacillus sp. R2/2]
MIEIKDLSLTLREPILKNANFNFQNGKIYMLHALNGTGKTSVLRTMVSLLAPSSGQVLFDGKPLLKSKARFFTSKLLTGLTKIFRGSIICNLLKTSGIQTWIYKIS